MFNVTCLDEYGDVVTSLYQWDYNQTLYIEDHGFTTPPQFHFCNQNSDKALLVPSKIDDNNVMTVSIPNILLTEPYNIMAYVYLSDDDSGKTVEIINLPVRPRLIPSNFEYIENTYVVDVEALAKEMRELLNAYNSAEELRVQAESVRISNENARVSNENSRISAESARAEAEKDRASNETTRQSQEATRQYQEEARQTNTATAIANAGAATERANLAAEACEDIVASTSFISTTEKGIAGGVATLDADGKIPTEQLPDELSGNAIDIDYDNTTSGLTATTVQAAIDELAESSGSVIDLPEGVTYVGGDVPEDDVELLLVDADTLGGHPVDYFATAESVENIVVDVVDMDGIVFVEYDETENPDTNNYVPIDADLFGGHEPSYYATADSIENIINSGGASTGANNCLSISGTNLETGIYKIATIPIDFVAHMTCMLEVVNELENGGRKMPEELGVFLIGMDGIVKLCGKSNMDTSGITNIAFAMQDETTCVLIVQYVKYDYEGVNQTCYVSLTSFGKENFWSTFNDNFVAISEEDIQEIITSDGDLWESGILTNSSLSQSLSNFRVTGGHYTGTLGDYATAEGDRTAANGAYSHAEGYYTTAYSSYSHAEGYSTTANGAYAHAEGYATTTGDAGAHAEGDHTTANGVRSHAEGYYTTASAMNAHAEGGFTTASGTGAHAEGMKTTASNYASHVSGKYNKAMTDGGAEVIQVGDVFVIGNGTGSSKLSNAFRVTYAGATYGLSAFNSSGADYAEFIYPWHDDNVDNEDRIGYFVTFKDGKLYKATSKDIILGVTSGNPSIVGNADEDYYWKYERDEFNRIVFEDVEEEIEKLDEHGQLIRDEDGKPVYEKTGNIIKNGRMKLNPDYDPSLQNNYVERKNRAEWDYVGMLGVLPVRDDGTCIPGQYCKCNDDGIATLATPEDVITNRFTYIVLERISDHVVKIIK